MIPVCLEDPADVLTFEGCDELVGLEELATQSGRRGAELIPQVPVTLTAQTGGVVRGKRGLAALTTTSSRARRSLTCPRAGAGRTGRAHLTPPPRPALLRRAMVPSSPTPRKSIRETGALTRRYVGSAMRHSGSGIDQSAVRLDRAQAPQPKSAATIRSCTRGRSLRWRPCAHDRDGVADHGRRPRRPRDARSRPTGRSTSSGQITPNGKRRCTWETSSSTAPKMAPTPVISFVSASDLRPGMPR